LDNVAGLRRSLVAGWVMPGYAFCCGIEARCAFDSWAAMPVKFGGF
jgi:hypothetical protein